MYINEIIYKYIICKWTTFRGYLCLRLTIEDGLTEQVDLIPDKVDCASTIHNDID